jgi:hypothetical protein
MSFLSSQRLARWSALAALLLGGSSCGNDSPDLGTAAPVQTTVAFSAPEHFGVNDAQENGGPRIAVGQGKTWLALWASSNGITLERSTDGGAHWSAPTTIAEGHGFAPDLACDHRGVCVAVWKEVSVDTAEHDVFAARSGDDGATWDAPVLLGRKGVLEAFNTEPVVATGGGGEWVIVWDAVDAPDGAIVGTSSRIEAVRSRDGAVTWDAPSVVDATEHGLRFVPRIAADEAGNYVVVFSEVDADADLSDPRTRLFAVRSSDGREWSAAVAVGANDPRATMRQTPGEIAAGDDGTWLVVYTVQRPDLEQGGFFVEVLAARSLDGGATWGVPQQLDEPGASTVELFSSLAADADGHVVVVWLTSLEANAFQLLTVQSADGGKTWSSPSDFPGGAANPHLDGFPDVDLAADDAGAWSAVWLLAAPGAQSGVAMRDVVVAQGETRAVD